MAGLEFSRCEGQLPLNVTYDMSNFSLYRTAQRQAQLQNYKP